MITAFVAEEDYKEELRAEIGLSKNLQIVQNLGSLFIVSGPFKSMYWAQWTLKDLQSYEFESINQAAQFLRSQGKNWRSCSQDLHRRTELIESKLPRFKEKVLNLGEALPDLDCGAWFLAEQNKLYWCKSVDIPYDSGKILFTEDKAAPSRAYKKLWETFARIGQHPSKQERVIDLGSCPGGWTWVLAQFGSHVISVDTARIDDKLMKMKNVEFLKKDAFKLKPEEVGQIDWLFSDIICFPDKLYELVQIWRDSGLVKNFVCTIKFKGETDYITTEKFATIPNSKILHLGANKHELTWICLNEDSSK